MSTPIEVKHTNEVSNDADRALVEGRLTETQHKVVKQAILLIETFLSPQWSIYNGDTAQAAIDLVDLLEPAE